MRRCGAIDEYMEDLYYSIVYAGDRLCTASSRMVRIWRASSVELEGMR